MGISVIGGPVGGASGGNGFSLIVGATGNTTYAFDTPQPAGAYSITSQLGDTTFDVYLVTADNTNAGYTNTLALEATAEFNRVVLYGSTANDILNFDYKPSNTPAASGDIDEGAGPFLSSATPVTLASVDDTTTVTGGNFASDVEIVFTGQDDVDRDAKSIVRSSSTSLIVTRPDVFPVEQEPYTVTAKNPGIPEASGSNANKLVDYFDAGSGIVWVTSSPLLSAAQNFAYSLTLLATDEDGTSTVYAVTNGTLPTGLSFNGSTGVISGTPTVIQSQTFTVTATDAGGNSSSREFTLAVIAPAIDYLVVAGGGGGGMNLGGGGGAGGFRAVNNQALQFNTNSAVTVGAGGVGAITSPTAGTKGANSTFGSITSTGGGFGSANARSPNADGGPGGSGGGPGAGGNVGAGNQGGFSPSEGSSSGAAPSHGGGGGGAGGSGAFLPNNGDANGSSGGVGVASPITGTSIFYAGGGGGGARSDPGNFRSGGGGGNGGGGDGASTTNSPPAQNGLANRGGGGGGGSNRIGTVHPAANGGSGVVIVRYLSSLPNLTLGVGLTIDDGSGGNVSGSGGQVAPSFTPNGFKVYVFKAGTGNVSWAA